MEVTPPARRPVPELPPAIPAAVSPKAAARIMGLTAQTVLRMVREGRLHCWKRGGTNRYLVSLDDAQRLAAVPVMAAGR